MFNWIFGNKDNRLEEETKKGFSAVKRDMDAVGKWVKHLDTQDKQLFDLINDLKQDLSSVKEDLAGLKEAFDMSQEGEKNKQLLKMFKKLFKQLFKQAIFTIF